MTNRHNKGLGRIITACLLAVILNSAINPLAQAATISDYYSSSGINLYDQSEAAALDALTACTGGDTTLPTVDGADNNSIWQTDLTGPYNVEDYIVEVLRDIASKTGKAETDVVTQEHVAALTAFGIGEGGNISNSWTYNLWNTGYSGSGVTLNTTAAGNGTQGYATFNDGVEASARTMTGKTQNRLATVLSDPNSTAEQFLYALTHFELYSGNKIWAEDSDDNPKDGVGDDDYYQSRLSLLKTVKSHYNQYASLLMGPPGNSSKKNLHVTTRSLRYQFDGDSSSATGTGDLSGLAGCGTAGTGGGLVSGGMTAEQAQRFMQAYVDFAKTQPQAKLGRRSVSYSGKTFDLYFSGCNGGPLSNCSTFVEFFVGAYTSGKQAFPSGSQMVSQLLATNSGFIDGGHVPKVYAIFSTPSGTTPCGSVKCGHTGVVLGIDAANDKIIIGEAGCSNSSITTASNYNNKHVYSLRTFSSSSYTYAYTDNILTGMPQ